jgi:hypothetical protein
MAGERTLQVVSDAREPAPTARRPRVSARAADPITQTRLRAQPGPAHTDTRPMDALSDDPRFRPAPLLVADSPDGAGDPARCRALRGLGGAGPFEVRVAPGISRVNAELYPMKRCRGIGGRPPLRGACVGLAVPHLRQAVQALDLLLERYPRTPLVAFTPDAPALGAAAPAEELLFVPVDHLEASRLATYADESVRAALLGVLWRGERAIPVVAARLLLGDPRVGEHFERLEFGTCDARTIARRQFAVGRVDDDRALAEHHLRTLDAHGDGIARRSLARVRGVSGATLRKQLSELRALLGAELEEFETQFQFAHRAQRLWGDRPGTGTARDTKESGD